MGEVKHTALPWFQSHRKGDDGNYSTQVYSEDGETICTLHWYAKPKDERGVIGTYREENAAFIVRACNSHYELIDRLEECMAEIKKAFPNVWEAESQGITRSFISRTLETLSKARGIEPIPNKLPIINNQESP